MRDERREQGRENMQANNPAELQRTGSRNPAAPEQRERRGPFTFAAGWLGTAFDRSRIDRREAEERRQRYM